MPARCYPPRWTDPSKKYFYTTDEVAKMLEVSTTTVKSMCKAGNISAIKAGKLWRIHKADFDRDFLKEGA